MEIKIPYQYKPRDYQKEMIVAPQRFKIAVIHRRGGKSKTALNLQIRKAVASKGIYYYILPTYKQAKQVIWDELVKQHVPKEIVEKFNESELAIYYKNGSIQRFVGAEDPDKHRGINPIDVVFDEYSEMKEEIWTAVIQPVLRENKGSATFIFTPKGKNHAWKLLQMAKDRPDTWYWTVKTVDDTDGLDQKEIDQAKSEMPEALFKQEFMCEFAEGAGAYFRRIHENLWHGELGIESNHFYKLGVDLAKYQDWTVITPIDLNTLYVGRQERFNQTDWNLQKARIEAVARRFNNARINVDSTGVGDPIAEDLSRIGLSLDPAEGFKFTEKSREQLLRNLAVLLEQDKIKIPNDEGLIAELESMRFEFAGQDISADGQLIGTGKLKIKVPDGMHDDRIMSLALAVWEVKDKIQESQDFGLYSETYN